MKRLLTRISAVAGAVGVAAGAAALADPNTPHWLWAVVLLCATDAARGIRDWNV